MEAEWWGAGDPPWHGCLSPACGPAGAAAARCLLLLSFCLSGTGSRG